MISPSTQPISLLFLRANTRFFLYQKQPHLIPYSRASGDWRQGVGWKNVQGNFDGVFSSAADESEPAPSSSSTFNFPSLSPDGSVEDIRFARSDRHYYTPPAALSTLGAKARMAGLGHMTDSTLSFSDSQYDMIDDLSEVSNDDHETASLASTEKNLSDDDGIITSEEASLAGDQPEHIEVRDSEHEAYLLAMQNTFNSTTDARHGREQELEQENEVMDSYMSENLETPRQSALTADQAFSQSRGPPDRAVENAHKTNAGRSGHGQDTATDSHMPRLLIVALVLVLAFCSFCVNLFNRDPIAETEIRREALGAALAVRTNCTDVTQTFNIEHLLPRPIPTSTNFFGQKVYATQKQVHYQGVMPNVFVVSVPREPGYLARQMPKASRVSRGDKDLKFEQATLIDGVYYVTIDKAEAHGSVTLWMSTKSPKSTAALTYNFGSPYLHRQTYEKVTTDISKSVTKDLNKAGKNAGDLAASLSSRLQLEIGAGMAATKNVTTAIALQLSRDLQVFVGKAMSAREKMQAEINKDVENAGNAISQAISAVKSTTKTLIPSKKKVVEPIRIGRKHALRLQAKLFGGGQNDANSTTASKELTTYVQNLLHPGSSVRKPVKLRDIVACIPAADYAACKKELQLKSKPGKTSCSHSSSMARSISTIPGHKVKSIEKKNVQHGYVNSKVDKERVGVMKKANEMRLGAKNREETRMKHEKAKRKAGRKNKD